MASMRFVTAGLCCAVVMSTASCASTPPADTPVPDSGRPTLVVLVVVDQLRADLLDRYASVFTGGFKRLNSNGYSFVRTAHDHAVTVTAAGHATLSTGVYPSRHGVVANLWFEKSGSQWIPVENIADSTIQIVGVPRAPGASPVHLMRPGFAEWLVKAYPKSKVASVSG